MWGNNRPSMGQDWFVLRRKALASRNCYLCGQPASEVDHVIPRSRGGGNELGNLKPICTSCHKRKSSQEGHKAKRELRERKRRPEGRHPGST